MRSTRIVRPEVFRTAECQQSPGGSVAACLRKSAMARTLGSRRTSGCVMSKMSCDATSSDTGNSSCSRATKRGSTAMPAPARAAEQRACAVVLQGNRSRSKNGLEPFGVLQDLKGCGVREQRPIADVGEVSNTNTLGANQAFGRVQADRRSRETNRNHPGLRRAGWLNRQLRFSERDRADVCRRGSAARSADT